MARAARRIEAAGCGARDAAHPIAEIASTCRLAPYTLYFILYAHPIAEIASTCWPWKKSIRSDLSAARVGECSHSPAATGGHSAAGRRPKLRREALGGTATRAVFEVAIVLAMVGL